MASKCIREGMIPVQAGCCYVVRCKPVSWFPFYLFHQSFLFNLVVKLLHYGVWTKELMSSTAFEACRGRTWVWGRCCHVLVFNMEQLLLPPASPVSICRVICALANYCWAELVTSFSLRICDGCWRCKNLKGGEERQESRAEEMEHIYIAITE